MLNSLERLLIIHGIFTKSPSIVILMLQKQGVPFYQTQTGFSTESVLDGGTKSSRKIRNSVRRFNE